MKIIGTEGITCGECNRYFDWSEYWCGHDCDSQTMEEATK